jgi:hypothetical protein
MRRLAGLALLQLLIPPDAAFAGLALALDSSSTPENTRFNVTLEGVTAGTTVVDFYNIETDLVFSGATFDSMVLNPSAGSFVYSVLANGSTMVQIRIMPLSNYLYSDASNFFATVNVPAPNSNRLEVTLSDFNPNPGDPIVGTQIAQIEVQTPSLGGTLDASFNTDFTFFDASESIDVPSGVQESVTLSSVVPEPSNLYAGLVASGLAAGAAGVLRLRTARAGVRDPEVAHPSGA